ncbi:zinc finger protein 239-like [Rhincodon typus]|uniref:zinc finger protein 239-like n=1 Tax=Rhincodon typus TaxID=259920 RepID=UPI00202E937F|nr:zinc finger protein 239-like [Rhincodon typus]
MKLLKCETCKRGFAQSLSLVYHWPIHPGVKPFTQGINSSHAWCGRNKFPNSSTLHKHHCLHTGERQFICKVCNKSFSQSSYIIFHQCTHTREKPFTCVMCDKSFSSLLELRTYQHIHTAETVPT